MYIRYIQRSVLLGHTFDTIPSHNTKQARIEVLMIFTTKELRQHCMHTVSIELRDGGEHTRAIMSLWPYMMSLLTRLCIAIEVVCLLPR